MTAREDKGLLLRASASLRAHQSGCCGLIAENSLVWPSRRTVSWCFLLRFSSGSYLTVLSHQRQAWSGATVCYWTQLHSVQLTVKWFLDIVPGFESSVTLKLGSNLWILKHAADLYETCPVAFRHKWSSAPGSVYNDKTKIKLEGHTHPPRAYLVTLKKVENNCLVRRFIQIHPGCVILSNSSERQTNEQSIFLRSTPLHMLLLLTCADDKLSFKQFLFTPARAYPVYVSGHVICIFTRVSMDGDSIWNGAETLVGSDISVLWL